MRQQPEIPMPGQMSSNNNSNFPSYPSSSSRIPAYRPQQQPPHHLQQQQQMQQFGTGSHSQRATSVANSLHSQMGPRSYQQVSSWGFCSNIDTKSSNNTYLNEGFFLEIFQDLISKVLFEKSSKLILGF